MNQRGSHNKVEVVSGLCLGADGLKKRSLTYKGQVAAVLAVRKSPSNLPLGGGAAPWS